MSRNISAGLLSYLDFKRKLGTILPVKLVFCEIRFKRKKISSSTEIMNFDQDYRVCRAQEASNIMHQGLESKNKLDTKIWRGIRYKLPKALSEF